VTSRPTRATNQVKMVYIWWDSAGPGRANKFVHNQPDSYHICSCCCYLFSLSPWSLPPVGWRRKISDPIWDGSAWYSDGLESEWLLYIEVHWAPQSSDSRLGLKPVFGFVCVCVCVCGVYVLKPVLIRKCRKELLLVSTE
jgi:hypothetical protein